MNIGCLLLFLLLFGASIIGAVIKMIGTTLNGIGAGVIWLWESFLNLFRSEKKEVINPFNGESNFDNIDQTDDISYTPTETPPKRYEASDGETIDYEDLPK